MAFSSDLSEKVSIQCQDNPYGFNGMVVFGDETYGMTPGCISDMTGYNQYLTSCLDCRHPFTAEDLSPNSSISWMALKCGNGFSAGAIDTDHRNNARASRQMLLVNVAVTMSAISAPMNNHNQLGDRHMDPPSTDGYALAPIYGWGGNGSQLWDRDEKPEEEEKNSRLKEKKKKARSRKRKRSRHSSH